MQVVSNNPSIHNIGLKKNYQNRSLNYNTQDIQQDSFVKSTSNQPAKIQNVSFGNKFEQMIGKTVDFSKLPDIIETFDRKVFEETKELLKPFGLKDLVVAEWGQEKKNISSIIKISSDKYMIYQPKNNLSVFLNKIGDFRYRCCFDANGKNNGGSLDLKRLSASIDDDLSGGGSIRIFDADKGTISIGDNYFKVTKDENGGLNIIQNGTNEIDEISLTLSKDGTKQLKVKNLASTGDGCVYTHPYYTYKIGKNGEEEFSCYPFAKEDENNKSRHEIFLFKNEKGNLMLKEGDISISHEQARKASVEQLQDLNLSCKEIFNLDKIYDETLETAREDFCNQEDIVNEANENIKKLLPGIGSLNEIPNITQERLIKAMLDATKNITE